MTVFNTSVPNQDALTRAHLSENHFGASKAVPAALERELGRMHLYPDRDCGSIRAAIARHHRVDVDMVTVGNGTDELILAVALAFAKSCVVSSSTFPGYATSSSLAGAEICTLPLEGYRVPLDAMSAVCRERSTVAFVCNPHNPTGTASSATEIEGLVDSCARSEGLPVFDEAYAEFAGDGFASAIPLVREGKRAIVTRTFSKAYGLAGFRIGYAIGRASDVRRLRSVQSALPFAVNRLAQVAAEAALSDPAHLQSVVEQTLRAKSDFYAAMDRIGIEYVPSQTNFVLLRIPGTSETRSRNFAARLHGEFGILSRDTAPFGLAGHVRCSMVTHKTLAVLCSAIEHVYETRESK